MSSVRSTSPGTTELAEAFITASRALVGIALRSLAASPVEVTLPQHRALVLLAADGPCPVGALAERLGVNASNASRLCDRLARLGLVSRRRSDADGRSVDVSLTPKGQAVLSAVHTRRVDEVTRVLAGMAEEEESSFLVRALEDFAAAAHEPPTSDWATSPSDPPGGDARRE